MNKIILSGRLTADPEVRYTQTGRAVASMTLAVNKRFVQEGQPSADFFRIVAWQKLAEVCGNNLVKGSQIIVDGHLQTRSYDAKDGSKRYITEVVAGDIEFIGPKPAGSGNRTNSYPNAPTDNVTNNASEQVFGEDETDLSDDTEIPF